MPIKVSEHRKSFRKSIVAEAISVAVMATIISTPAFSAEKAAAEVDKTEVIMVTATKKSQTIQEVPLAVTALTGDFMEKVHLTDVKDIIAYSPGVNGNANNSFLDTVSVRGIRTDDYGAGGDGSLGIFKNDQYEGRNGSAVSTLYDMDRAEIVNGPQGFLFGRNAIGGAISVHTKRAEIDFFDANVNVDLGEYGLMKVDGAVNIPISDNFAMRFAGVYHQEESYFKNNFDDKDLPDTESQALRWSTTFKSNDTSIYTMVEYEDRSAAAGMYSFIEEGDIWDEYDALWGVGNRGEMGELDINAHWGLRDEAEILNLQVKLEHEFDFADLSINAGYKDYDYFYGEQWIPSPLPTGSWAVDQSGDYAQLEMRLSSNGSGPLSWYVGASTYKENLSYDTLNMTSDEFMCAYYNGTNETYYSGYFPPTSGATGHCANFESNLNDMNTAYYGSDYYTSYYYPNLAGPVNADGVQEISYIEALNTGWATYANLDYQITDTLNVEFGIRYTLDNKEFSNHFTNTGFKTGGSYMVSNTTAEPIMAEKSWDDTTFKYLIRWKPSDTAMLYASYTEGFKSGGFSSAELDGVEWGAQGVTNADATIPSFEPEYVESYEIGYKDTWLEDTDVRLTLYMYDYFGLQITQRSDTGGGVVIKNSGEVNATGIEGATNTTLTDNWNFMLNFHYIDSESFGIQEQCFSGTDPAPDGGFNDCEGSKLHWVPEFSGSMVLGGHFPLESGSAVTVSLESYWETEHEGGYDFYEEVILEGSQVWNARLGYESDSNWYVEAYVDNLTDENNYDSTYLGGEGIDGAGAGAYPAVNWASWKPRSFGVRFGMSWE
jgi:iron complex outermembrane receptor protein